MEVSTQISNAIGLGLLATRGAFGHATRSLPPGANSPIENLIATDFRDIIVLVISRNLVVFIVILSPYNSP
ncbi:MULTISPECIES: hypothetical protein [Moorena]|uniref:hypothetical protein n=1 Tax=Moorena TaxID=1155738 RepID=UPI0025FA56C2|nr:hypothetical protein [Moorena sp. SIO4G3]